MHLTLSILLLLPSSLLISLPLALTVFDFEPIRLVIAVVTLYNLTCLWLISKQQRRDGSISMNKILGLGFVITPIVGVGNFYLYIDDSFGTLNQLPYFAFAPTLYAGYCGWLAKKALNHGEMPPILPKQQLPLWRKMGLTVSYLYFCLCYLFILVGMGDTLFTLGYGAVGDLLSPTNLINWGYILLLTAPGILLHQLSLAGTKAKTITGQI